ncbi:nucleotidyltransferase family protein [Parabacteroides sp. 52]|uniref:nucleotidyltransferase family protein n=1 Tax=unclassified Parabacteroides TaxID=2649774 RepID=UPI0013CFB823|nr:MULTISPECIES: nucleotidyltransferase family protein [unclassified Parabacteroides]MDH6535647.1 MurNAc alpha-1-phosphate uridylyltransferase [Parabacteroides sp. PM5-20]NDV56286.1 nucleotidyltransferase family protein [Parabacteroides sp. 52]
MKAMIFAAGMGTRLKPLTDNTPKALIPVGGKPMLEHIILKLKTAGFDELVINIHHEGQQILDFLAANENFGVRIHISDERDYLLDTGGGIKKAFSFLEGNEPFLVHNVDIFSNVDLQKLYHTHAETNPLATLLVSKRKTSRYLLFNKENKLCGWRNHETGEVKSYYPDFDPSLYDEYAFGGIHVLSPQIFEWMEEWTGKFSIINFYLSICAKTNIYAYPSQDLRLLDIGKPEALEKAEQWLKE